MEPAPLAGVPDDADIETAIFEYPEPCASLRGFYDGPRSSRNSCGSMRVGSAQGPGFGSAVRCDRVHDPLRRAVGRTGSRPAIFHAFDWPWSYGVAAVLLARRAGARSMFSLFGDVLPHREELQQFDSISRPFLKPARFALRASDVVASMTRHCRDLVIHVGISPNDVLLVRVVGDMAPFHPEVDGKEIPTAPRWDGPCSFSWADPTAEGTADSDRSASRDPRATSEGARGIRRARPRLRPGVASLGGEPGRRRRSRVRRRGLGRGPSRVLRSRRRLHLSDDDDHRMPGSDLRAGDVRRDSGHRYEDRGCARGDPRRRRRVPVDPGTRMPWLAVSSRCLLFRRKPVRKSAAEAETVRSSSSTEEDVLNDLFQAYDRLSSGEPDRSAKPPVIQSRSGGDQPLLSATRTKLITSRALGRITA